MKKLVLSALLLTVAVSITCSSSDEAVTNDYEDELDTALLKDDKQAIKQEVAGKQLFRLHHLHHLFNRGRYSRNRRIMLNKMKGLVRQYVTQPLIRKITEAVNGELQFANVIEQVAPKRANERKPKKPATIKCKQRCKRL